jgi:hypothetical protein
VMCYFYVFLSSGSVLVYIQLSVLIYIISMGQCLISWQVASLSMMLESAGARTIKSVL